MSHVAILVPSLVPGHLGGTSPAGGTARPERV